MVSAERDRLRAITNFDSLIEYLRDDLDWPIEETSFDALTFDYEPEELGIDPRNAAKIDSIRQLRPLVANQPWGIFFVEFEPTRLPVIALRRILNSLVLRKRASANMVERAAWQMDDLLFISNYGNGDERQINLAHFAYDNQGTGLPGLSVLGWDNRDTPLHLDQVHGALAELKWPEGEYEVEVWREAWTSAFTLRHREVITTSRDLAIRLAELARAIRDRINTILGIETENGPMTRLLTAFRQALIHDLTTDGFADMYAQTIAYGLLSSRVASPIGKNDPAIAAALPVTNPFLRDLMMTFLGADGQRSQEGTAAGLDFDELGVNQVVDLLDAANMESVLSDFGDRNLQQDPVVYFYELFLKEYDTKKRMQRGVFYTPRPVVTFIVHSVDQLLRTEFGLVDGLADTTTWGEMTERIRGIVIPEGLTPNQAFVQILDPAVGTGTFLVEVIDVVYKTMTEKWRAKGHSVEENQQLWNEYVTEHLLPRLHGYELMMAPYAIAHMNIGIKLYETGYVFGSNERVRVYLTNSLEPPSDQQIRLGILPALAQEAKTVNEVKRFQRFTVVIGNPPYAKISSNRDRSAEALVNPFKVAVRGERNIQPLSDDYLKFLGFSLDLSKRVQGFAFGMITNRGHLIGLIHRGVRQVLSSEWSRLWLVDLHGDSNVHESAPKGAANENVFDIQQGVAISIGIKTFDKRQSIRKHDIWGTREEKQSQLKELTLESAGWVSSESRKPNFFFDAINLESHQGPSERTWPLNVIMPLTNTGIKTHRDSLVIDFDSNVVKERIERFVDPSRSDSEVRSEFFGLEWRGNYQPGDNRDWSMSEARTKLQRNNKPLGDYVHSLDYRPMDRRSIFYNPDVVDFHRRDIMRHMEDGQNLGLIATRQVPNGTFCHVFVTRHFIEMKTGSHDRATNLFPLWTRSNAAEFQLGTDWQPNFDIEFLKSLAISLHLPWDDVNKCPSGISHLEVFGWIYAVLHSNSYRDRYANILRIDFPPIPIPIGLELFRTLTDLGEQLITYHLLEFSELDHNIAVPVGLENSLINKVSYSENTVWIDPARTRGFQGVPEDVWNFHIGGYQVCEKWLKDRGPKKGEPGRMLNKEDLAHYQKIVVALTETIRVVGEIDHVIDQHGGWPGAFAGAGPQQGE